MSRNRILITAVAAALLVVCGIGIFFASNRDHAAERADEWTMQGMTLAPDGSATPCTVRIAGTSRSYLLGGRVGAFETGTDGGIYVDGTRVCSGVILPDDAFDPWLTMQADTDPFWIASRRQHARPAASRHAVARRRSGRSQSRRHRSCCNRCANH